MGRMRRLGDDADGVGSMDGAGGVGGAGRVGGGWRAWYVYSLWEELAIHIRHYNYSNIIKC